MAIEWTNATGSLVTADVVADGDKVKVVARVGSESFEGLTVLTKPANTPGGEVAATIGTGNRRVGLTTARLNAIREMRDAAEREVSNSPRATRKRLVHALNGAQIFEDEVNRSAVYATMAGRSPSGDRAATAARNTAAAREALDAFDAAHPEILAALRADRAERAERAANH